MRFLLLVPAVLLAGCAISAQEREQLIEAISKKAAEETLKIVEQKGLKEGLSPQAARELAELAAQAAARKARELAEKRLPEPGKETPWGAILLAAVKLGLLAIGKGGAS